LPKYLIEFNGKIACLAEHCRDLGLKYATFQARKKKTGETDVECLSHFAKYGLNYRERCIKDYRFYGIWYNMLERCTNPTNKQYKYYGGKGITVCERWLKYEYFEEDMYKAYLWHVNKYGEKDTTLDRIKGNRNYMPNNCRWATWEEQHKNKKFPMKYVLTNGQHLYSVCKKLNLDGNCVANYAINHNITIDDALDIYIAGKQSIIKLYLPCKNYSVSLKKHCEQNNYNYNSVRNYIYRYNLQPHEALARYLSKFGKTKYWLPCDISLKEYCIKNNYAYSTILKYIKKYNLEPQEALARYLKNKQKRNKKY